MGARILVFPGGRGDLGQVLTDSELLLRAICELLAAVRTGDPRQFPPLGSLIQDLPLGPAVRFPTVGNMIAGAVLTATWPRVPQGMLGIVRGLGVYTDAPDVVRVQARVNGAPIAAYDGIFGAIGALDEPFDPRLDLNKGEVFDVVLTNTSAVVHTGAIRTFGWFYPDPNAT